MRINDPAPAPATSGSLLAARLSAVAPLLLIASIAARLAWTYLVPTGANFVDLHVYVGGAATLGRPGELYDFVYADQTPDFPLPFTYPPFAAVVFYPLTLVPFGLLALAWQLGIVAALYGVVRTSQRLLTVAPCHDARRVAMLWTAVGIWTEPLRSTFDYGQINVVLVLAVLGAVYSSRWWLSGLLVGLAAGVKLTPAVSGLYFLGARRWGAAVFSGVVFVATVGLSLLVVGDQARYYFTDLLGDADRVGPVGTSFNQSWRGAISRILGYDAGYGPWVLAGIVVTAALALLAWRAVGGARDRLAAIVIVQLFGLLLSPISWTHHWVWVIPLMIWLLHGPLARRPGARVLGWGWLALTLVGLPWLLSFAQPTIWEISRPWYLAWAGLIYPVASLVTLAWVAVDGRSSQRRG
ncbi:MULTISPECIES: mannosyltransferase [Mycobacteriaceae]|uniref:Mannosyltransferase n=1 Tax=Mycolicibacterium parafortuitum TaxID=39692 RepID=A0ACC6MDH2_MYCPF|nr:MULTISPECIES: mannosyltransferase [Mycobacteriaceae]MDZ5084696.1 mannosyltransferase [Mycolicibacterium parafortuitum]BBA72603.1 mannosyltransferase [Mycobacterium sp. PO1]BBA72759.1 mannosyltransferase [Mycobacterium sp. PO2]GFM20192.1 mannosyltransferase [Mycobacterium sp. PO1]GFM23338.1 mannosyltransferase [Mycobacterium sp. PO2]